MDALQREWSVMQTRRVLALLQRHPVSGDVPLKRWAVHKLLTTQPLAHRIRFEGRCHCKATMLMSYVLPFDTHTPSDPTQESAGFFCPSCKWGNAGTRERA